jgi:hypothetical protein
VVGVESVRPLVAHVKLKKPSQSQTCDPDGMPTVVSSGPNKPYKKPGLAYRPGQAEGVGLDW